MRPNVVLIVFDAARADAFEPYGAPVGSSPAVADLANRGKALPLAYAPGSWTVPSHASLFTGLLPRAVGIRSSPGSGRGDVRAGHRVAIEAHGSRFLPEVLRQAGYSTAAVSANLWLRRDSGFAPGFQRFVNLDSTRHPALHRNDLRGRLRWDLDAIRARADDGAAEAERLISHWLQHPETPFFWFVNLIECHSPYLPPKPYNDLGPVDRLRAAEEARRHLTFEGIWKACAGAFDVPSGALERMRHLYRRALLMLDDWLGRVLTRMDEAGLLDETLVVVMSDHGENLGENGLLGHAFSLDDRLLHVPFVTAGPSHPDLDKAFSLAALPSLIAHAVGIDDHPWDDDIPPPGVAVAQFDPPTGPGDPRILEALERWGLEREAEQRLTVPLTCATDGHRKLLIRGERQELYDLHADPHEVHPSDPATARDTASLTALADALAHPGVRTVAPPPETGAVEPEADIEELERKMKLLGYM